MSRIKFEKVTEADLPMLVEWHRHPHVAEWWGACGSVDEAREEYLPRAEDASAAIPYIAYLDGEAIGFAQSYVAMAAGDGWWTEERDPGVRGIDQFLADERRLGQGLGTRMVREFVEFLFRDLSVTRIQADPAPGNARAIRCYEKAGFRRVGIVETPDGEALLMTIERRSISG
jgi:RimJ/RimL family protein N-acetyltransferase